MTSIYYAPARPQLNEPLNVPMYLKYMAELVSVWYASARVSASFDESPQGPGANLKLIADAININTTPPNPVITTLFGELNAGVAYIYSVDKTQGAHLFSELVKPVNPETAALFSRLCLSLQVNTCLLNYAKASNCSVDAKYAMVSALFILSKFADLQSAVADACHDMLGLPERYFDSYIELQRHLGDSFFGKGWEHLYLTDEFKPIDIVNNILVLRPPFVESEPKVLSGVDLPTNINFE